MPVMLLKRIDEARGEMCRSEYISHICEQTVMGYFPRRGELTVAHGEYVHGFEAHLRTPAGIDTALDIAAQLAVSLRYLDRRRKKG